MRVNSVDTFSEVRYWNSMLRKGYAQKIPFSPAEAQEMGLQAEDAKCPVYIEGRDAETFEECMRSFRGEPGELWVFGGYRVLGGSRDKIMSMIRDLKKRKIVIVDVMNKERSDQQDSEMLDRALRQIMGSHKLKGSRKHARGIAAKGGRAKGSTAAAKRAERVPGDSISRLLWVVENRKVLTWRLLEWALGGKPFSTASLRRHYAPSPPPPPPPKKPKSQKARKQ